MINHLAFISLQNYEFWLACFLGDEDCGTIRGLVDKIPTYALSSGIDVSCGLSLPVGPSMVAIETRSTAVNKLMQSLFSNADESVIDTYGTAYFVDWAVELPWATPEQFKNIVHLKAGETSSLLATRFVEWDASFLGADGVLKFSLNYAGAEQFEFPDIDINTLKNANHHS